MINDIRAVLTRGAVTISEAETLETVIVLLTHVPDVNNCPMCGKMWHIGDTHECEKEKPYDSGRQKHSNH